MRVYSYKLGSQRYRCKEHVPEVCEWRGSGLNVASWTGVRGEPDWYCTIQLKMDGRRYSIDLDEKELMKLREQLTEVGM